MFSVPEKYRVRNHPQLGSDSSFKNKGLFSIPMGKGVAWCIASDGLGWEHVSVHIQELKKQRTPTWEEMCRIKDIFWGEDDAVIQYHPPRSEYVNIHDHVLHLWRPTEVELPRPQIIMV